MTRNKRLHSCVLVLACVLPACDPDAKNLGENLDQEDTWMVDWRVGSGPDIILSDVEPAADGGVLVVEGNSREDHTLVRHYTADGALLWTSAPQAVRGGHLATAGSAIFLAAERGVAGSQGERASLQRFSSAGTLELEYAQARAGDSNSFSFDVAASTDEVAIVIGNWGEPAYEGEPRFEIQRLDHELQPIGNPIGFDAPIEQIAYDAAGKLVILEVPEEGLARVHRPLTGLPPALVDCVSLLTSSGAPLCANGLPDFALTNYETGEIQELGSLDLENAGASRSTRASSTVFATSLGYDGLLQVVEVLEDGAQGRHVQIPLSESGVGGIPVAVRQLSNGAVYATVVEDIEQDSCSQPDGQCFQSHLLRLAAN